MPTNIMRSTLIILSLITLAGCSSLGAGVVRAHGVVAIDSYKYEVVATRSTGAATDLEVAELQVYSEAKAFCAKQDREVETVSLARFEEDLGRPASATLRFRCVKP
jgi:hypothetical protein